MMRAMKFCAALAAASLAVALLVATITGAQDSAAKGHRIDVLIAQAEKDRAAAASERASLLAGQAALTRRLDQMTAGDRALLEWLRHHGITPPTSLTRYLTAPVAPTSGTTSRPRVDLPGKSDTHRRHR